MKKLVVLALISLVVLSGCIKMNPELLAKSNEQIKQFLDEHPNAEIKLLFLKSENVGSDPDFIENCEGVEVASYYKVSVKDPDSNLEIISWVDDERVVCVFKKGEEVTTTVASTTVHTSTIATSVPDSSTETSTIHSSSSIPATTLSSEVETIEMVAGQLEGHNKVRIEWEVDGHSSQGFKIVWSMNEHPTYPTREGDQFHYKSSPETREDTITDLELNETYYFRVCEYMGGECGVYSNEELVTIEGEASSSTVVETTTAVISTTMTESTTIESTTVSETSTTTVETTTESTSSTTVSL